MDNVHFLNLEYLVLRVYETVYAWPIFHGIYSGISGPAADTIHVIATVLGIVAVAGMFFTIIFFVMLVWVRVRLEIVEHEGFAEKEIEMQPVASVQAAAGQPVAPKNARWERVHELANTANESDWRLAILEADIMLGDLLKAQGYRGDGIGELLRDANPLQFTTLDLAWQAHKVRNDIAHAGQDFHLSQREANATIDLYRRVFEEFKFI